MRSLSLGLAAPFCSLAVTLAAASGAHAQDARALGSPSEASAPAATTSAPVVIATSPGAAPAPPPTYGYVPPSPREDAPPATRPRDGYQPTWALLGPGLGAFISTYGGSVLAGAEMALTYGTDEVTAWLFVPVVGPWVLVGYADGIVEAQLGFALLGLAQTAGAALMVAGLAINARAGDEEVTLSVAPMLAPGSAGLSALGRF